MAKTHWIIGLLLGITLAGSAAGQTPPYDAVVRQSFAEVRGGRSSVFPVTGQLRPGQAVRVLREEAGWLAISPPDGSSSWVPERVLDVQPQVGQRTQSVVRADNVPLLLGAQGRNAPFPNQVATVANGTVVVVLGEKALSDALGEKSTWWRIQPTPREVRWIAKDALTASITTSLSANPPSYISNAANRMPPPPLPSTGRTDPATPTRVGSGWPEGVLMTSGPGILRRAAFQIDGRPAFALEDTRGYPRVYVVAQPGINLEPFINRQVEMFGPMINRPDMTFRGYMTVGKLHLLR